jgi:hypothetical protein
MTFYSYEVPVAYSMVALAVGVPDNQYEPFQEYLCYWTAFNNIYATIAERVGLGARLSINADGTPKTKLDGHLRVEEVQFYPEQKLIDCAFREFSNELKHNLIMSPYTRFFVYRTPRWQGAPIETDSWGQRLNGVLNVGRTVSRQYPVWSPIKMDDYEQYVAGNATDRTTLDHLSRQILYVLYTVRNNLVHGGKRADDANDGQVVQEALPLLRLVVMDFLDPESVNLFLR